MARIERIDVSVFVVPTPAPESDGTIEWDRTTAVVVEAQGGGVRGLGWTYASRASADIIREVLAPAVCGLDADGVLWAWQLMLARCRNLGRTGAAMMAISAVDVALWDLRARILGQPLTALLGRARERVPIYGSGGFTSYDEKQLCEELAGWVASGIPRVKMKVGRDPASDPARVAAARKAIGEKAELFVDANGAYSRTQAARLARDFVRVSWFEEPISSDDLDGLRALRSEVPPGMAIAAGEYGFDPWYFTQMLSAQAVDVLQADATRCGGVTGFLRAAAIADGFQTPLSAHCAPNLHAHLCCAVPRLAHLEYFRDHVRVERLLFDGVIDPRDGTLAPGDAPGLGLALKRREAERHAA